MKTTPKTMTGAVLALLAGLFCGQLVAGEVQETQTAGETAAAVLLLFDEEEPGTGTYPVRYLVTDDFLRIDDNYDASDYVLLDRQTSTIYSVSHEYGNVLVINRQPAVTPPHSLELTREPVPDEQAPAIDGRQPQQFRYLANGELCYQAVLVPGLLPAAVAALAEYEDLLAGQQVASLENTPMEFRTPCYLSRYIYAPGRHLEQGLPVQVWDNSGFRRALVNFSAGEEVARHLFSVPSDYREITIGAAQPSLDE
jgi:hypothetical protein